MKTSHVALLTLSLLAVPLAQAQTTAPATPATAAQTVTVTSVELKGFTVFDPAQIRQALAGKLGIKPGASVSAQTLETGRQLLTQSYQQEDYLFTPEVKLTQAAGVVTYTVDESAPVSRVEVTGVTLIGQDTVQNAFKPLHQAKRFTLDAFQYALTQLSQAYSRKGIAFNAQSVQASLNSGVLRVAVTEPFVESVDASRIKTSSRPTLQTRAGQPLRISALNADARALSNASGQAVSWQAAPATTESGSTGSGLRVTFFHAENAASERVKSIVVKGNTSVPTADILRTLKTQVGDVASPQLAQQDYYAIQNLYDGRGYGLSATDDSLDFQNGVLTFNLHEARIGAYQFNWEGGQPLIDEKVLTRQLPATGRPFNRAELQQALGTVDAYHNFTLVSRDARALDAQHPENLTVVLNFAPRNKGIPLGLAGSYDSQNGLGGELAYTNNNILRTGNALRVALNGNNNDVGQRFSGSVNYTIPWIDTNFLNLGSKRTSLNVGAWSQAGGNNTLFVKGADGLPTATDTGRQYTTRDTGASVTLNRELTPQLSGRFGVQVSKTGVYLEPFKSTDSSVTSATYQDDSQASAQLPLGNTTALSTLGFQYDTTDSGVYPSQGVRAGGTAGYGFGVQSDQSSLSWTQLESGASTYLGFGRTMMDGTKQTVLAARVNAGTLLGTPGESSVYRVGGSMNPAYELRGQTTTQAGTTYLTASTELRHNFGVHLGSVVQGVYGLAFVDTGDAWRQGSSANTFNLNTSYGVGTQLNTSFANLQLTYGLTTTGSGKFTFRLGNFW